MAKNQIATPSYTTIPPGANKRRFWWRWWWLLIIPAAGGIVVLALLFPQIMGVVGLAVLSAVVASLVTWALERISKGKGA